MSKHWKSTTAQSQPTHWVRLGRTGEAMGEARSPALLGRRWVGEVILVPFPPSELLENPEGRKEVPQPD